MDGNTSSEYFQSQSEEIHIKRPQNSFMVWSAGMRLQISKCNPTKTNSEISIILGKIWNDMSDEYKLNYKLQADLIKIEHSKKYPDYVFKPKTKKNIEIKEKIIRQKIIRKKIIRQKVAKMPKISSVRMVNMVNMLHMVKRKRVYKKIETPNTSSYKNILYCNDICIDENGNFNNCGYIDEPNYFDEVQAFYENLDYYL